MKYLVLILMFAGCTDAQFSKMTKFDGAANITCYSGGVKVYEGRSTGAVNSEANSDGYYFRDAKDGRLKEVSGDCIIDYE